MNDVFQSLFVLDVANNHQGDQAHGRLIIQEHAAVAKRHNVKAAIKFQFRDLPNFVHETHRGGSENKHVERFLSTKLSWDDYKVLLQQCRENNVLAMCTPFDEVSVDKIVDMGFDYIKVASCSARDWPLLEKVSQSNLPIVVSTGGLELKDIDALVSFFSHRDCQFALMHCVAIYPTPDEHCNILNIRQLTERFPNLNIGWSTHEPPDELIHVGLALASGATMFERHIGIPYKNASLNAYSSTPKQIDQWLGAYQKSLQILGGTQRIAASQAEIDSLDSLKRGVYVTRKIESGSILTREDVEFAFPCGANQLSSGQFFDGIELTKGVFPGQALLNDQIVGFQDELIKLERVIKHAIHEVKGMLSEAKITLGSSFQTEYSHHYGIENFREVGTVLITVVNRVYAKKLLVQLPGQRHPAHMHKLKEETFIVLSGDIDIWVDGKHQLLTPGDQITVLPGSWHHFSSEHGAIVEEISTTAIAGDSVYKDQRINQLSSSQRKTEVDNWGRFQINEQIKNKLNIRKDHD